MGMLTQSPPLEVTSTRRRDLKGLQKLECSQPSHPLFSRIETTNTKSPNELRPCAIEAIRSSRLPQMSSVQLPPMSSVQLPRTMRAGFQILGQGLCGPQNPPKYPEPTFIIDFKTIINDCF